MIAVVVPIGEWVHWESANLRGSPATHAVDTSKNAKRTLCGRNPENWDWVRAGTIADVNCKICVRRITAR